MVWKKAVQRLTICLLTVPLVFAAAGCAKKSATPSPTQDSRIKVQSTTLGATATKTIRNPKQVAAHLEHLAKGIKGVRNANCVVFGKYAVVGIDVDSKMDRSRVGTVKYAVAEAFRKDPYGIDALVTADVDMAERVREIRADVKRGRPVAGFTEELADIVGRLVPQIPRNIVPPAQSDHSGTAKTKQLQNSK